MMQKTKKTPFSGAAPFGGPSGRRVAAKAVGSFLPNVTKKAFEKFGFPAAALLTDWEAIVGPQLAAFSNPEKVKWPKVSQDEMSDTTRPNSEAGGTLILRVDGPLAIELQHQSDQLLDRINRYFGYRAIASLRILQAPLSEIRLSSERKPAPKPRDVVLSRARADDLATVENPALRDALADLARRIAPTAR